jgi:hypothetical protein
MALPIKKYKTTYKNLYMIGRELWVYGDDDNDDDKIGQWTVVILCFPAWKPLGLLSLLFPLLLMFTIFELHPVINSAQEDLIASAVVPHADKLGVFYFTCL